MEEGCREQMAKEIEKKREHVKGSSVKKHSPFWSSLDEARVFFCSLWLEIHGN